MESLKIYPKWLLSYVLVKHPLSQNKTLLLMEEEVLDLKKTNSPGLNCIIARL